MRENRCYDVELFVISPHSETFSREKIATRQLDNNALCCVNRTDLETGADVGSCAGPHHSIKVKS